MMPDSEDSDTARDEWTAEERQLLAALPRERTPPADLKARTLQAVHRSRSAAAHSRTSPRYVMALAAAAAVIFSAGTLAGYVAAIHSTHSADASQAAKPAAAATADNESADIHLVSYVIWY